MEIINWKEKLGSSHGLSYIIPLLAWRKYGIS
jgi:hypothetical protein